MEKTLAEIARQAWCNTNSPDDWQSVADAVIGAHEARRWRPIATAPQDISVLIYVPGYEHYGPGILRAICVRGERWHTTCWAAGRDLQGYEPTHWTALPAPPKEVDDAA